jgi:hypothetical protein
MSAILSTPTLPTMMNLEDLKTFIQDTVKSTVEPIIESVVRRVLAEQTPIENVVETVLATSELKVLKRLSTVETVLGLNDMADEDEPTIPEQIKELANRIEQPLNKSTENIEIEVPVIPSTTLELKASAIVEHLKESVKPRNDAVFMNSREILTFLKNDIPEDLRLKDIKNPRQAKKDILEKAVKLFSDSVQIIKNKSGNKVTGIALKPSVKCRYTDTC